jgi:hypothetical protein
VNVFAPLNVNTDAPDFVNENAPPIAPLKTTTLGVVTVVFEPNVPAPLNVNCPVVVPSPNVTDPSNVYPFANTRAVVESLESVVPPAIDNGPVPNPAAFPTRTVPALTVTPPEKVFAPLSVSMEAPNFVNDTAPPPIAPPNVTALGAVTVVFAVNVPAPLNVNAPVFVPSPNVTVPPIE